MMGWVVRIVGGFWAIAGLFAIVGSLLGVWAIFNDPTGGYDLLPLFLLFIFLPFGVLSAANAWALLTGRPWARALTTGLSSLLILFAGGFLIYRTWFVFRFVPTPLLLVIGLLGFWTVSAKKIKPPKHHTPV